MSMSSGITVLSVPTTLSAPSAATSWLNGEAACITVHSNTEGVSQYTSWPTTQPAVPAASTHCNNYAPLVSTAALLFSCLPGTLADIATRVCDSWGKHSSFQLVYHHRQFLLRADDVA